VCKKCHYYSNYKKPGLEAKLKEDSQVSETDATVEVVSEARWSEQSFSSNLLVCSFTKPDRNYCVQCIIYNYVVLLCMQPVNIPILSLSMFYPLLIISSLCVYFFSSTFLVH